MVLKTHEEGQRLGREAHGQWFSLGKARGRDGKEGAQAPLSLLHTYPFIPYTSVVAQDAVTAPTMAPMMPGMPCRL